MIGEVVLALQAVNALASAVSESAGHASTLGGIVGKLAKTNPDHPDPDPGSLDDGRIK